MSKYFVPVIEVTGRRARGAIGKSMTVSRLRSDTGRKAFSFRGPNSWNNLPLNLRCIDKFTEFKKAVSEQVHDLFGHHPT